MTPTERFAILMFAIGVVATVLGWLGKRLFDKYDKNNEKREADREKLEAERRAITERHTAANHEAIVRLSGDLVQSNKEMTDRIVTATETTSRAILDMSKQLALIQGRQEGRMVWDGVDRRGPFPPRTDGT